MIKQFDSETGKLYHLISLDDLPASLYYQLFDKADSYISQSSGKAQHQNNLSNCVIVSAFFEPSTRTRLSFEVAARRLGAYMVNFDVGNSATAKGETVADTLRVIECLGPDLIVLRSGHKILDDLDAVASERTAYINGGDGSHAHPSQGLLDVWTVYRERGSMEDMQVAIIGDILHSRVARSTATAFTKLGANVRVAGPPNLLPDSKELERLHMQAAPDIDEAVRNADVVVCLRIQFERIQKDNQPHKEDYISKYRFDERRLKLTAPDSLILHPGPMNRDIEITSTVADGPQSCILKQVTNGVAMRMAIMHTVLEHKMQ